MHNGKDRVSGDRAREVEGDEGISEKWKRIADDDFFEIHSILRTISICVTGNGTMMNVA